MKKYCTRILFLLVWGLSLSMAAGAQFVIKIRPAAPLMRPRPLAPSPAHVWVSGNYVWRGGQYAYEEGYWAKPPVPRSVWVDGHWRRRWDGWVWIPGHWKRWR